MMLLLTQRLVWVQWRNLEKIKLIKNFNSCVVLFASEIKKTLSPFPMTEEQKQDYLNSFNTILPLLKSKLQEADSNNEEVKNAILSADDYEMDYYDDLLMQTQAAFSRAKIELKLLEYVIAYIGAFSVDKLTEQAIESRSQDIMYYLHLRLE